MAFMCFVERDSWLAARSDRYPIVHPMFIKVINTGWNIAIAHMCQCIYPHETQCSLTAIVSDYQVEEALSWRRAIEYSGWFLIEHFHTSEALARVSHLSCPYNLSLQSTYVLNKDTFMCVCTH